MKRKVKHSKTPPRNWPSEKEWERVEKELEKAAPSRGLPAHASPVDRIKYDLCSHFVRYCLDKDLSQRELAKVLGVSESRVSEIVHYHHERFTIDKLIELLAIIRPRLKVSVAS